MRLTSLLRAPPTIGAGLHAGGRHEAAAAPFVRSACSLVSKMSKIVAPKKGAVENIGFEPMASCMPCKRSSQLS